MVNRNFQGSHRFVRYTDDKDGIDSSLIDARDLWDDYKDLAEFPRSTPSALRRLKMYARDAADWLGDRIFMVDLDIVITDDLTPVLDRPEDFVINAGVVPFMPYSSAFTLHFVFGEKRARKSREFFATDPDLAKAIIELVAIKEEAFTDSDQDITADQRTEIEATKRDRAERLSAVVYSFLTLAREAEAKASLAAVSKPQRLTELDEKAFDKVIVVSSRCPASPIWRP
jgi:hypothetical protein